MASRSEHWQAKGTEHLEGRTMRAEKTDELEGVSSSTQHQVGFLIK
jgi:hypothetical protein